MQRAFFLFLLLCFSFLLALLFTLFLARLFSALFPLGGSSSVL